MGIDGAGIFDNDTCGDFLSATCRHFHDAIRNDLDTLEKSGGFERTTPAAISILLGIATHIPLTRCFIEPGEITEFRDRYLQWFDADIHEAEGGEPDFLQQWRRSAEQEFNALIAICSES